MPIKTYTPPKLKLVDHRNPEGGFYTADCDVCGTEFYPKRSNAKYCSPKCAVVAHRTAVANGTQPKKEVVKSVKAPVIAEETKTPIEMLSGRQSVVKYLKGREIKTHGLLTRLESLKIGDSTEWNGTRISRESTLKYGVKIIVNKG